MLENMDRRRLQLAALGTMVLLGAAGVAVMRMRQATAPAPAPVAVRVRVPARPRPTPARDAAAATAERSRIPATVEDLKSRLDARWRLAPDRRLALALQFLASLRDPNAPAVEFRAAGDRWTATLQGASIATLPATPTFEELLAAATAYARTAGVVARLAITPSDGGVPVPPAQWRDPWVLARTVDARWTAGTHTASDVALLGRTLAVTFATLQDPLGVGDPLAARALAALAVARAAGSADAGAEALLCKAMTYTAEASHRAAPLASTDPAVHAWVTGDGEALGSLADGRDPLARLLADTPSSEPYGDADATRRRVRDDTGRLLATFEREEGITGTRDAPPFARFAAVEGSEARGTWIDRTVAQARRRARFGDALTDVLGAVQASTATPPQAQELLALLGIPAEPLGEEWLSWARGLIVASAGGAVREPLLRDASRLRLLGVAPAVRSLHESLVDGPDGSPAAAAAVEAVAHRMDQRPAHRLALGLLLLDVVCDVSRGQATLALADTLGPGVDGAASARLRSLANDRGGLLRLAESGPVAVRIAALRALAKTPGSDVAAQDAAWQSLATSQPSEPTRIAGWAQALVDRRETARARELLEHFLNEHGSLPEPARRSLSLLLADAHLRLRDAAAAARVLRPWADADWPQALLVVARAQIELGSLEEAERTARRAWERDEHPASAALLAEVRWRRDDPNGASEALGPRVRSMSDRAWEESVGAAFDAVFSGRSQNAGQEALDGLTSGVDVLRRSLLLEAMFHAGHPAIAGQLHEHLVAAGASQRTLLAARFAMRLAADGELAATEWLQEQVPPAQRPDFAEAAYDRRLDEVLWSVVEVPPGGGAVADRVWLLRAASSLRRPDDSHRAELLDHLRVDGSTWGHVLARHLFDQADLAAVRAAAESDAEQWQTPYYLGLRAQSAGAMDAAADWFLLALDPDAGAPVETTWAVQALRQFARTGRALATSAPAPSE